MRIELDPNEIKTEEYTAISNRMQHLADRAKSTNLWDKIVLHDVTRWTDDLFDAIASFPHQDWYWTLEDYLKFCKIKI